jgi:hypothetical protein
MDSLTALLAGARMEDAELLSTIRPWQLFQHLGDNNRVEMVIPTIPGTESLTVFALETQLLIAAARIVKAQAILEVGTSLGYTAMHLAMNTDAEMIWTMDLVKKPRVFDGVRKGWAGRIRSFIASTEDLPPDDVDMVFIDGDHSREWLERDTEFAFKCNPRVIAWHDYGYSGAPDVKPYLNELAETKDITHVEDSMLCFWFLCPPSK